MIQEIVVHLKVLAVMGLPNSLRGNESIIKALKKAQNRIQEGW